MAIIDNRTSLDTWETNQPDDLAGAPGGTADTVVFIEGLQSYGYYTTSTRDGLLYDHGTAINRAGQTVYIWVNCSIVGLLTTRALGGLRARFCGAVVSDFFEVNLAGSDDYPAAVSGGWTMFVVDVDKAKIASDGVGGTPPATSAIQYVGITTLTDGTMPRMVDNTWLDAMWSLAASTPGILVEGVNTTPDWAWDDIVAASSAGSWGTASIAAGGAVALNTPVRFGANDAVTHGFSDSNKTILWEDWDVSTSFYGLEVIGGSGVQSFELGIKTGTLDSATGAQGCVIQAAPTGSRWFFDCDDANVDVCNLYGCSFLHGGDFQLDSAVTSVISTLFVDCTTATVTGAEILRCAVIDANTLDSIAFMFTDDIGDIVFCTFQFSDGHGLGLLSGGPASQTSKGNLFSGYGGTPGSNLVAGPSGSTDAAISNDSGVATDITITDSGDSPSVRNETGTPSTVIISGAVTTLVTVRDHLAALLQNARVRIEASDGTGPLPYDETVTITAVASVASVAHTAHGMVSGTKVVIRFAAEDPYNGVFAISNVTTDAYDYTMTQGSPSSPATIRTGKAAIKASGIILEGLTDVNGEISSSLVLSTDQNVKGVIRKSTSSPYYRTNGFTDVVDSVSGLTKTVQLVLDE